MDIVKTTKQKNIYRRYWWLPVIILVLVATASIASKYRNVSYITTRDSLLIGEVVAGDLSVSVRGYGQLVSRDVYWIGAQTQGRVSRILAKPGDHVAEGDVLVELLNPQLLQDLKDAELEYAAHRADVQANQVERKTHSLDLETEAATAEIDYQTLKMNLDAKTELMSKGLQIISRLDYESTQLSVQKLKQRWDMQLQRVSQSKESLKANSEADETRLSKTANELQKVRDQVDNLQVRASVEGIIQEMNLELGQQLSQGENITRIASPDQLVAEVKIQELQVNDIQLGMPAKVDTRSSEILGFVSRIDPAVIDGSVLVEIELQGVLPKEVRPDLNIEASISVANVPDTLSVRRPVFARPNSEASVYRLNADGDIAQRVNVRYGEASSVSVEILEGLQAGDRIIVSDPNAFNTHERIFIR